MAGYTILDPKVHQNLKVITDRGNEFGENQHLIPVTADELKALVSEYTICFLKDNQTGQFGINAITGFEPGENLFLKDSKWTARYVPLHLVRQPFMVGIQGNEGDQPSPENTVVTINLESTRVSQDKGESLFDEQGKPTAYLKHINNLLVNLVQGVLRTEQFIQTILQLELLAPIKFDVTLASGEKKSFGGMYGIDEEKLSALSGDALQNFHQKGYLQACHLINASFPQIQKLIDWKNKIR